MKSTSLYAEILDGLHELDGSASITDLAAHVEHSEEEVEHLLQEMEGLALVKPSVEGLEFAITEEGRKRLSDGEGRLRHWIGIPSRWIDPETGRPIEDWR